MVRSKVFKRYATLDTTTARSGGNRSTFQTYLSACPGFPLQIGQFQFDNYSNVTGDSDRLYH